MFCLLSDDEVQRKYLETYSLARVTTVMLFSLALLSCALASLWKEWRKRQDKME